MRSRITDSTNGNQLTSIIHNLSEENFIKKQNSITNRTGVYNSSELFLVFMPKSKDFFDQSLKKLKSWVGFAVIVYRPFLEFHLYSEGERNILFIFTKYCEGRVQRDIYTTDSYKSILRCYVLVASWLKTSRNSLNDKTPIETNTWLTGFLKLGSPSSWMDKIDKGKMTL